MARNASGNYSLPSAVNPVQTRSTITSNWANTTLTDIETEITNSLDRTGRGAMTGQLQLAAGTAAAPGLTFDSDTNCGIYRKAADDIGFATGGTLRANINSSGLTIASALQIQSGNGTVSLPPYSFSNDVDTGMYLAAEADLRLAIAGVDRLTLTASQLTIAAALSATAGTFTAGITVTQSGSNSAGATVTGNGSGAGIVATGGATGVGADIYGGATNGGGAVVTPDGTGIGVDIQTSGTTGRGLVINSNSTAAAMRITAQTGDPSGGGSAGDLYVKNDAGTYKLMIHNGASFVVVGTQT